MTWIIALSLIGTAVMFVGERQWNARKPDEDDYLGRACRDLAREMGVLR